MAGAAYRLARGRALALAILLTFLTGMLSALLNDVTVMLLIAPVTIELALILGIHPFALLVPEIFAANIGGASTLIGDPPNLIIGSFAKLGFLDFLAHMGPMGLVMTGVLTLMVAKMYGREYGKAQAGVSAELLERLDRDTRITEPGLLRKGLLAFSVTMVLFFLGDVLRMPPSVAALLGRRFSLLGCAPMSTS